MTTTTSFDLAFVFATSHRTWLVASSRGKCQKHMLRNGLTHSYSDMTRDQISDMTRDQYLLHPLQNSFSYTPLVLGPLVCPPTQRIFSGCMMAKYVDV